MAKKMSVASEIAAYLKPGAAFATPQRRGSGDTNCDYALILVIFRLLKPGAAAQHA